MQFPADRGDLQENAKHADIQIYMSVKGRGYIDIDKVLRTKMSFAIQYYQSN